MGMLSVVISPAPAASNIRTTSRGVSAWGPPSSTTILRPVHSITAAAAARATSRYEIQLIGWFPSPYKRALP